MESAHSLSAYVPTELADELVAAGLAQAIDASSQRGLAEVLAVIAVVPTAAATTVTLLQGPATVSEFVRRARLRRNGLSIEVRAPRGNLTISLEEVPDDGAVSLIVQKFLEKQRP